MAEVTQQCLGSQCGSAPKAAQEEAPQGKLLEEQEDAHISEIHRKSVKRPTSCPSRGVFGSGILY